MTQSLVGPRQFRWLLIVMALGVIDVLDVIGNARAFAQGGITSSLSGTVVDSTGSLIPGIIAHAINNGVVLVSLLICINIPGTCPNL